MAEYRLHIYIDPRLMMSDECHHGTHDCHMGSRMHSMGHSRNMGQMHSMGNLCIARKVNDCYNVVFQGMKNNMLTMRNDFQWEEDFAMGATMAVNDCAHVCGATTVQPIQPGQVCAWMPGMADMPSPTSAPGAFPKGSFGTTGMPIQYHGSVYCSTGDGGYSCMYVDAHPKPGLDSISYMPKNQFCVFWDEHLETSDMFMQPVRNVMEFSFPMGATDCYMGWGLSPDGMTKMWSNYHMTDPGRWTPTGEVSMMARSMGAPAPVSCLGMMLYPSGQTNCLDPDYIRRARSAMSSVMHDPEVMFSFRLGWDSDHSLDDEERRQCARDVASYMMMNCDESIHIRLQTVNTFIIGDACMKAVSRGWMMMMGENDHQKMRNMLRNMLTNIRPQFAPTDVDWNYSQYSMMDDFDMDSNIDYIDMVMKMGWPAVVGVTAAAAASAHMASKMMAVVGNCQIEFDQPTTTRDGEMIMVKGCYRANAQQVAQTIQQINSVVSQEASRSTPVKGQPGIPTPDNVMLLENAPAPARGMGMMRRAMSRRYQQQYQMRGGMKRNNMNGSSNGMMNGNGMSMKGYSNGMNGQINGMKMISA